MAAQNMFVREGLGNSAFLAPHHYEARRELVAALRSGRYRQIRGAFHDDLDGHCVLGLAERLALDPSFTDVQASAVIALNDTGSSFAEIAELIETDALESTVSGAVDEKVEFELDAWEGHRFQQISVAAAVVLFCVGLCGVPAALSLFSQ